MLDKVVVRLNQLGFEVEDYLLQSLDFEMKKVVDYIKSFCGVSEISDELVNVVIERTCGNFIFLLKNLGKVDSIDNDGFVKEILEGDVKVVFDENSVLSAEQRLDKIIDYLMSFGQDIIVSKRCICW